MTNISIPYAGFFDKFLINYPLVSYSIVILYVLFVKWIGPAIMRKRKPYSLQKVLIAYNFIQALANLSIFSSGLYSIIKFWDSRCVITKNENFYKFLEMLLNPGYNLYILKFVDLLDTVFFVLRKKQNQVSFLHVFHHAGMCLLFTWGFQKLHLILSFYLLIGMTINTAVHVIMYTYYGLAAIGPHMQKYLWWKKHLTRLQIGQIFFVLVYMVFGFLTGCEEFGKMEMYSLGYGLIILLLFLNFYRKYEKA
ncbi:unnamed protein product [Larinioides sclopetarius]|uniref:Elongation of very long chain fatty acids protein n=1 Tax=Larinioides sclopetarius TaxID=280406 RepID=A0AAV2AW41_9ARAC